MLYTVQVFDENDDVVFECEYDGDKDVSLRENVAEALDVAYHGCTDRD